MASLEELINIPDKEERRRQMLAYAESLDIKTQQARNPQGELDENRLTVLIFDAERAQKEKRLRNVGITIGLVIIIVATVIITLLFVMFKPPTFVK